MNKEGSRLALLVAPTLLLSCFLTIYFAASVVEYICMQTREDVMGVDFTTTGAHVLLSTGRWLHKVSHNQQSPLQIGAPAAKILFVARPCARDVESLTKNY